MKIVLNIIYDLDTNVRDERINLKKRLHHDTSARPILSLDLREIDDINCYHCIKIETKKDPCKGDWRFLSYARVAFRDYL